MTLSVECPPKLNLYLRVVRRREDGYHELETVFQSVSGGDTLTASPAAELTLACDDPNLPTDDGNLVLWAARVLRARYPTAARRGAELRLTKRTPAGAGMGGGSVDGAAALVLLSRLWDLSPAPCELEELAAGLGSDVPFFLVGGAAAATGRGEQLRPAAAPRLWLVLVRPPAAVSTPWAYRQWRAGACSGPGLEEFLDLLRRGTPAEIARGLRNDLEPGVAAAMPEIGAARDWLLERGALGARMTGSGSVVFGVAADEEHARRIAAGPAPGRAWVACSLGPDRAALRPHAAE